MDFYYIVKAVFNIRNKHTTPYLNHNPKLNETHEVPPGKLNRVLRKNLASTIQSIVKSKLKIKKKYIIYFEN